MSVNIKWNGDKVLGEIEEKVAKVTGKVSLPDLLAPEFMRQHSKFGSIKEMIDASKLAGDDCTTEDLAVILGGQAWDQFVAGNSVFGSWKEMMAAAGRERIKKSLKT